MPLLMKQHNCSPSSSCKDSYGSNTEPLPFWGVSTWNELHPTIRNKVLATLIPSLIEDFLISSGQWR